MPFDATHLETHRTALTAHCYRMLGSPFDAEDAVQETMVRAWRSLHRFDGRASLRTWLYRIATNVCLDALSDRARRPSADVQAIPADGDPLELTMLRQRPRLAFVAALQHLPARQRAALLLTEVVGWSAAEVAECLDMSVAAVNSALQRARTTLASRDVGTSAEVLSDEQAILVDRYVEAFHRYDVDELVSLMRPLFGLPPESSV